MEETRLPRIESGSPPTRVFISHTSSDKDLLVRPLVRAMQDHGVDAWFDEISMQPGDSLVRTIDKGLIDCDFAVIVVSPAFMRKKWPEYEFASLVSRELHGSRKLIVPVWFNVSREDVAAYSLAFADKLAINATGKEIYEVAREILAVVRPEGMISLRAERMIRERSSAARSPINLDRLNILPVPIGPVSLSGRDAVGAILAELAFPYMGTSDIDGMFADLSKEPHPQSEIFIHQTLAASYLLTLHLTSDQQIDESTRRHLREYILLIGSGVEAEAIAGMLPDELIVTANACVSRLTSIGRTEKVVVTSKDAKSGARPDGQVQTAAFMTKWFGQDSQTIQEAMREGLTKAEELSNAKDFEGAANAYLAIEFLALQLEGVRGEAFYFARANYAYHLGMAGSPADAAVLFREVRDAYVELKGVDHPATESAHSNLADFLGRAGMHMEACAEYEALLDRIVASDGMSRDRYQNTKNGLAHVLLAWLDTKQDGDRSKDEIEAYLRMAPKAFGHHKARAGSKKETDIRGEHEESRATRPSRSASIQTDQQELF